MIMELPVGAVEFEVPENLKILISKDFKIEAIKLQDGDIRLAIIKIKNVSVRLSDIDLTLPSNELKSKIIEPMLHSLNRI